VDGICSKREKEKKIVGKVGGGMENETNLRHKRHPKENSNARENSSQRKTKKLAKEPKTRVNG